MKYYFNSLTKILACLLVIVGCSPSGNQSSENTPTDFSDTLDTNTSAAINTSASSTMTIPPAGQQPYQVVHGVGQVYELPNGMTYDQQNNPTGYRVNISISTDSN